MYIHSSRVSVKGPEAKLKGGCEAEGAFTGTLLLYIDHQLTEDCPNIINQA